MNQLYSEYPTINLDDFRELCRLEASQSPPFIVAMIKGFLEDGIERLRTIKALVKTKDFAAAGRCAHNLKSSGCYLGLVRLAKICSEFEHCGADSTLRYDLLQQIQVEFDAVNLELQKYLNSKARKSLLKASGARDEKKQAVR